MIIEKATVADAGAILELQKIAYQSEAELYNDYTIEPLVQTLAEMEADFSCKTILKAVEAGKIVGTVRADQVCGTCRIGRLCVLPEYQNRGIGTRLLKQIEALFADCVRCELYTGFKSVKNLYVYQKMGYQIYKTQQISPELSFVFLERKLN